MEHLFQKQYHILQYALTALTHPCSFLHKFAQVQSGAIGVFFIPCVASYLFGLLDYGRLFSKDYSESRVWSIALVINLVHLAYNFVERRLLPEHWPLSAMALFPWSDHQWTHLHRLLTIEGDTRVVVTCDPMHAFHSVDEVLRSEAGTPWKLVSIEHKVPTKKGDATIGALSTPLNAVESLPAYDIWNRLIGVTTYQQEILHAFHVDAFHFRDARLPEPSTLPNTVRVIQSWLQSTGRMVEITTGRTLCFCYFVRVDPDTGSIIEIINDSPIATETS